ILNFYGKLYELDRVTRDKRIAKALELVGLSRRKDSKLKEFSKGMLQRVGIASLLLNDGELFFLDEPTYGLDPLATKEMRNIILSLKKRGKTIFLNTHQISEVHKICDRVGILHEGRLIRELPVSKIKGSLEEYFVKTVKSYGK
ncbi:MAG: ABC transporter ATP-binding protein, partial [Candidatus Firestonebacteria bacterium]